MYTYRGLKELTGNFYHFLSKIKGGSDHPNSRRRGRYDLEQKYERKMSF